jgi:uncharacterized YigZ family protein
MAAMLDTLAAPASHELEIKHSRFLAQATPISNAAEALAFISAVSDADATHNCWAYRHGNEYRSSDDGEPAGTAGRPILAAIDGQGYDRIAVVVTRWYGGIKLGAGGLVRAYGGTAAECLRLAERRPLVPMTERILQCGFEDMGIVHTLLGNIGAEKIEEHFLPEGLRLHVRLPADQIDALALRLRDATRDRLRMSEPATHD